MKVQLDFPHSYEVKVISERPGTSQGEHYFPSEQEVGGDCTMIEVVPYGGPRWTGLFERGYKSPEALTGIFATPNEDELCVVASGEGYLVRASDPTNWEKVRSFPIRDVRLLNKEAIIVFADFTTLIAYNEKGVAWKTPEISWDGLKITEVTQGQIKGLAWDAPGAEEVRFYVDAKTGVCEGGSSPQIYSAKAKQTE